MTLVSILMSLSSSAEQTRLLHVDFSPQSQSVSGRGFLSMVNWDEHTQCVDAEVPLAADTRPMFAIVGDTLIVAQNVVGVPDVNSVTTIVKMYEVPACGNR